MTRISLVVFVIATVIYIDQDQFSDVGDSISYISSDQDQFSDSISYISSDQDQLIVMLVIASVADVVTRISLVVFLIASVT